MKKAGGAKAFTLIELLIVVAIIAILAAIAVPNFLEAQVRSKVSRVRADMRSLAVAEEAYFTDWNSYTNLDKGDSLVNLQGWRQLTSPIAYITSLPTDPFGEARNLGSAGARVAACYELGSGAVGVGPAGASSGFQMLRPSDSYEISCHGPDHVDNTMGGSGFGITNKYAWNEYNYPWLNIPANDPAAVSEALTLIYDPTNGTISGGNILRFGGQKPPGRIFDVLYAASSK
ncbi:prepilin-type N-terminal cleavage/methylation domain-containing protein [Candidatus Sumerlaeota bacterium]|nr:prepilin-type N-terminal cleavage/methylation domain-containing protein [Candidatus Sumerlaeota bacterium]